MTSDEVMLLSPPPPQEEEVQEEAREIVQGKPYHWRDWSIIRGRESVHLVGCSEPWSSSNGSNGWFRFILDGKLATMYSSGSPEGGSDSSGTDIHTYIYVCVCVCVSECLSISLYVTRASFTQPVQGRKGALSRLSFCMKL